MDKYRLQMVGVYTSLSWRVTHPVRQAVAAARGTRAAGQGPAHAMAHAHHVHDGAVPPDLALPVGRQPRWWAGRCAPVPARRRARRLPAARGSSSSRTSTTPRSGPTSRGGSPHPRGLRPRRDPRPGQGGRARERILRDPRRPASSWSTTTAVTSGRWWAGQPGLVRGLRRRPKGAHQAQPAPGRRRRLAARDARRPVAHPAGVARARAAALRPDGGVIALQGRSRAPSSGAPTARRRGAGEPAPAGLRPGRPALPGWVDVLARAFLLDRLADLA